MKMFCLLIFFTGGSFLFLSSSYVHLLYIFLIPIVSLWLDSSRVVFSVIVFFFCVCFSIGFVFFSLCCRIYFIHFLFYLILCDIFLLFSSICVTMGYAMLLADAYLTIPPSVNTNGEKMSFHFSESCCLLIICYPVPLILCLSGSFLRLFYALFALSFLFLHLFSLHFFCVRCGYP